MTLSESMLLGLLTGVGSVLILAAFRGVLVTLPRGRVAVSRGRDEAGLIEGLAVWVEQLRDAVMASSGLEQAVTATSATAPSSVRPAVQYVASELGLVPAATAFRHLADVIPVPLADLVSAVLVVAAEQQVRDVGSLLSHLAECCRDEVRMRERIWVSRSRTRAAMRIIVVVVIAFPVGLLALSPQYLAPYGSAEGWPVLSVVVASVVGGMFGMHRMARIDAPDRLVGIGERS